MKRYKMMTIFITVMMIAVAFVGCDDSTMKSNSENNFATLLTYCEKNATAKTDSYGSKYYLITWSDSDSSGKGDVLFKLQINQDKSFVFTGESVAAYNSFINSEVTCSVKFTYGSEANDELAYYVRYFELLRVLKSSTNYSSYVLDEYEASDSKAVFNTKNFTASCYYETSGSTNNMMTLSNPTQTLRNVSCDSFKQINTYLLVE